MQMARYMMPDEASAERLVETVLLRAVKQTDKQHVDEDIRIRLFKMLEEEYRHRARFHLH